MTKTGNQEHIPKRIKSIKVDGHVKRKHRNRTIWGNFVEQKEVLVDP